MKSIKAWNGTMEMEWNWNKQTIVFGKRLSSTNKPHRKKKLWLLVHFYILFLKLCKKKNMS